MLCSLRPSSHSLTTYESKVATCRIIFWQYHNERVIAYSVSGIYPSMYIHWVSNTNNLGDLH